MKPSAWQLLVISSGLALMTGTAAAVRPHYGGTVRVAVLETPTSLDPAALADLQDDHILPLIFEGLTGFDARGRLQPQLATRWQSDSEGLRWQFSIRNGVKFCDGTPLTAGLVAASLRAANAGWTITSMADSVTIETGAVAPDLPAELALPRNAIMRRAGDKLAGTGPFRISGWQPGRKLVLSAYDDYWGGRPFIDSLEITLGQNWRQQMVAMDLGRAEVAEVAPEQIRRATMDGKKVFESAANELIALVFTRDSQSPEELRLRQTLSAAIDRASIRNVLLQGQGEAATSILPNWMTGYAFLFTQDERTKDVAAGPISSMVLSYEAADPASQLIAERVALNAREAGISLQPTVSASNPDVRLLRIPLQSADPQLALAGVAASIGLAPPQFQGHSPEELYARERDMLQSGRIIPLVHVPQAAAVAPNLAGWFPDQWGTWRLEDVWLESAKP